MWGIIPAAGSGSRIQPLAFSKELLPVGSRMDGEIERPKAVSEYLIERMISGGVTKICIVISAGKSDIMEYYGGSIAGVPICYAVQPRACGLCDAIFQALPLIHTGEEAAVGLPDTIWFPADALRILPAGRFSFLVFPVDNPGLFDAVVTDGNDNVLEIQVKDPQAKSPWIWGAFKFPGAVLHDLYSLWMERGRVDEYFGTLVNAYIAAGGNACAVRAGKSYVDVGTLNGYRRALQLLSSEIPGPDLGCGVKVEARDIPLKLRGAR